MVPSFALRLQSMMRSIQEVILPAIPKDQQLALDQAKILLGNLRIMETQEDKIFQYLLVELNEYVALLRALTEIAEGGNETNAASIRAKTVLAEATPLAAVSIPRQSEIDTLVKSLKQAADDLVSAAYEDGDDRFKATCARQIMRQSEAQIARERSWFAAAGFELDPGKLPPLDQVLKREP